MNEPLDVKELREAPGLSQADMANLLGVKRGLLSMNEVGRRALPAFAMIRLNQINEVLLSYPDVPETGAKPEPAPEMLKTVLARCRLQKINLEKEEQAQSKETGQKTLLRKLLLHLEELNTPGYSPGKDAVWKTEIEAGLDGGASDTAGQFLHQMEKAVVELKIGMLENELQPLGWEVAQGA